MANFQTHLNGGIFVRGAAVLALHGAGLVEPGATLGYFVFGVAGSLLPDLDADASKPVRAFFNVLGVATAFIITLPLVGRLLALELALLWGGVYLLVRYLVFEVFTRLTTHRGIWHSWLGLAATALMAVNLAHWGLGQDATSAWLSGLMVAIGYLTHLGLDELFSVDLLNSRVKRSFGTALKPFSLSDPRSSVGMGVLVLVLIWFAPNLDSGRLPSLLPVQSLATLLEMMQTAIDAVTSWTAQSFRTMEDFLNQGLTRL